MTQYMHMLYASKHYPAPTSSTTIRSWK